MGSAMSSYRRPRGFVFDPTKGVIPLLGLQVLLAYGHPSSARPPATAALFAANMLVFLRPRALKGILPRACDIAFNPHLVLRFRLWKNFFLSPFYHFNEFHLFCNMTSLLWMGFLLETSMGTAEFASMVAALLGLSEGITIFLTKSLCLLGDDAAYYDHHSIGFSAVLYGMITVLTSCPDDFEWLSMMVIPPQLIVWADMFLTQALVSQVSFHDHLAGILAGYVFLWLKRSFKRLDPLTLLISGGARVVTSQVRFVQKLLRSVLPQGQGRVGCHASARECPRGLWRCSTCTNYNSLSTDICEICSTMREDHAFSRRQQLSVEEIHCRRARQIG